jgi:peroxiredoxin
MKKTLTFCVLLFALLNFSFCSSNPGTPVIKPEDILKNDNSFLSYIGQTLSMLSQNYTAYDVDGKEISKMEFLKQVNTGKYLYILLNSTDNKTYFKLYELHGTQQLTDGQIIYAYMRGTYDGYLRVGKKFSNFDFTDINGNHYTNESTKGKILVIKYWFIHCGACVAEMPELNKLVQQYKNRKDVLFISVAPDSTAQLKVFFSKRRFDYVNVGDQRAFIYDDLKIDEFPTQFIINKQGIIVNVVRKPEEVDYSLKNDL